MFPTLEEAKAFNSRHDLYSVLILSVERTGAYSLVSYGHNAQACELIAGVATQLDKAIQDPASPIDLMLD